MTPAQIDRAQEILQEEAELAIENMKKSWVKNGEDFPDLATLALKNQYVVTSLEGGALLLLMMMSLDRESMIAMMHRNKTEPGLMARDPTINGAPLDMLWLGYRLGRRMEHEEMEKMKAYGGGKK